MSYKIISPFLLQGCKDNKILAKMINLLPETNNPTDKRKKDLAFSTEYLEQFETPELLGIDIRQSFTNYTKLRNKKHNNENK